MSVNLDSKAVFQSRCKEINLSTEVFDALDRSGFSTYAGLAYCSSYIPGGSGDEVPFVEAMKTALRRDPTGPELAMLRRMVAEAHTFVLSDMRAKLEQRDDSAPRRMAVPERKVRLEQQQARLGAAIVIASTLEPSHWLIDEVEQQREDSILRWISLEKCCSRTQELQGEKKESRYQFDPISGLFKSKGANPDEKADLSSELLVRNSFIRRALAYDQSGLLSYATSMAWVDSLFVKIHEVPIPNYRPVGLSQCLMADKELWIRLSETQRGSLVPATGGSKRPLDDAFTALTMDHSVTFLLLPLPSSQSTRQVKLIEADSDSERAKNHKKEKKIKKDRPGKTKPGSGAKGSMPSELQSYSPTTPEGKFICWNYNLSKGCSFGKAGGRCKRGLHVCIKCYSKGHCLGGC